MTFRQFVSARFADRRARRAHKAMFRVYGESWARNSAGVVDLLSSPSPVYVLDAAMLRGVVAEALAASTSTDVEQFGETFEDEALAEEPNVPLESRLEPTSAPAAEVDEPSPRGDSIFAERSNGVEAVPLDMSDDDKRRRFVRSFLDEQKAARGGIPTSLRR